MIRIRNYERFQHYKNRKPPWIKLYRRLLDDRAWRGLSDLAARLLIELWLLASESETPGEIDEDVHGIAWRLRYDSTMLANLGRAVGELHSAGFVIADSGMLATCKPDATSETERERETEREVEGEERTRKRPSPYSVLFEEFWSRIKYKEGKKDASRAFAKLAGEFDQDQRLALADKYNETIQNKLARDPGWSPIHPATWINGRRWEDETSELPFGLNGEVDYSLGGAGT